MKHIQTLNTRDMAKSAQNGGCGECQTSCQSACNNLHETYGKHPRGRPECVSTPAIVVRGRSVCQHTKRKGKIR